MIFKESYSKKRLQRAVSFTEKGATTAHRKESKMKYIRDFTEGSRVRDIYLCKHKQSAVTKNGKNYENLILQDKTGNIDAKIWEPNSPGICDFDAMDYVLIQGDVSSFAGSLQLSIKQAVKASEGEYDPADYLPVSKFQVEDMYAELLSYIRSVKNIYLRKLLEGFFIEDEEFIKIFKFSSAAKTVHHSFVGGLLQHTLSIVKLCDYYSCAYPRINRDLLLTAAMCHDMGKTKEISPFPVNDYTDEGQLLGHIIMGVSMVHDAVKKIEGFSKQLEVELTHCIIAHHGELEYGSPKKPALIEALALNLADNTDAKLQTMTEILDGSNSKDWLGYNRLFESNIRRTGEFD